MNDPIKGAVELAAALVRAQAAVAAAEFALEEARKHMLRLEREDLPMAMQELGLTELKLESGQRIILKEEVDARISDDTRAAAIAWLDTNGFGDLIKTNVEASLGREQRELKERIERAFVAIGLQPEFAEGVHPATLKSFVKEQLAAGTAIPFDLFHIYPYNKATVKNK